MLRSRSRTLQEKKYQEQANIIQAHYSSSTRNTSCQNPSKSLLQATTSISFYLSGGSSNTPPKDSPMLRTGPNSSSPPRDVVIARRNKQDLPSLNTTPLYSITRIQ